ncbi:MAG: IPT/TIG domain-containing protein [Acidobacteria bacterium]|nr:IPT/TIG domain-containing protein [Acidobacteriota bacterium]
MSLSSLYLGRPAVSSQWNLRSSFLAASRLTVLLVFAVWIAVCLSAAPLMAQIYTDLHDFNCLTEGCQPDYPAILAQGRDGNLYGTTQLGGTNGLGTAFKITPSGTYTTLYNFSTGPDGFNPVGGLTLGTDGNFYGTTSSGGAANLGTIFKMTPAGVITTLYSFSGPDGGSPRGAPIQGKNGQFYGTTCSQFGPWTAYSITTSGKFKLLTKSIPPCPFGGLVLGTDGSFYGTSQVGGDTYRGTVFRMTPAGGVKILHNFEYVDGAYLYSPVVQGNDGMLYGTTSGGGSGQGGVIFKIATTGKKFLVMHEFDATSQTDGATPFAGLVAANDGKFYGATSGGENFGQTPAGTLFQIGSNSAYTMLLPFDGTHGGEDEATPMQHTNGTIYSVTQSGGPFVTNGVVYSLDMGLAPFVSLMTRWGTAGQTVEILGNGLTGTTAVHFGSGSATFNVVSDTYMTAVIPADGTADFVTVTTPSGTLTSNRTFFVTPVISAIAPASGPVGTIVTITGSGLGGATQVKFGAVKATNYTVNSGTSITATVPSGAKTGKVAVTTAGGTVSSKAVFTVTP